MDELICYTSRLPAGETQNITFMELLLDDHWADGGFSCPESLYCETGDINHKLTAKQDYEFLLRAMRKHPLRAIGTCPASAVSKVLEPPADWESFRTDCYVAGKYQQELLASGSFNLVAESLLASASRLPNKEEAMAWMEKMISHAEEYFEIDDCTRPILIYRCTDICYNTLNQFAEELASALRGCRQIVEVFNVQEESNQALTKFIGCRFKAVIGIQSYVFSIRMQDNRTNLHDLIHGPKYNLILDHPAWLKEHIENGPADYYLLIHDRNYCAFAKRHYKKVKDCIFFPPGGMLPAYMQEEKRYGLSFVGTYYDYRERLAAIYAYARPKRFLAARFLHRMKRHPNEAAEKSLRHVLNKHGITPDDGSFLNLFFELRQVCFCIMLYYREKVISSLLNAGIETHVYSDSWLRSPFAGHPCLHCHPALDCVESLQVMQSSKISLNIMSWHKAGLTERILNGMLCQSVVLSDRSAVLEEEFTDGEDLVLFDLEQPWLLPEKVKELLADESLLQQISRRGRYKVMRKHLWRHRAMQFLACLPDSPADLP